MKDLKLIIADNISDLRKKKGMTQAELAEKRARFNEVMELLAPKTEEQLGKTDDDTVQEQSRAYLSAGGKAVMT